MRRLSAILACVSLALCLAAVGLLAYENYTHKPIRFPLFADVQFIASLSTYGAVAGVQIGDRGGWAMPLRNLAIFFAVLSVWQFSARHRIGYEH